LSNDSSAIKKPQLPYSWLICHLKTRHSWSFTNKTLRIKKVLKVTHWPTHLMNTNELNFFLVLKKNTIVQDDCCDDALFELKFSNDLDYCKKWVLNTFIISRTLVRNYLESENLNVRILKVKQQKIQICFHYSENWLILRFKLYSKIVETVIN